MDRGLQCSEKNVAIPVDTGLLAPQGLEAYISPSQILGTRGPSPFHLFPVSHPFSKSLYFSHAVIILQNSHFLPRTSDQKTSDTRATSLPPVPSARLFGCVTCILPRKQSVLTGSHYTKTRLVRVQHTRLIVLVYCGTAFPGPAVPKLRRAVKTCSAWRYIASVALTQRPLCLKISLNDNCLLSESFQSLGITYSRYILER